MSKLTRFRVERLVQSTPGFESGRRVGERERESLCARVYVFVCTCVHLTMCIRMRGHTHMWEHAADPRLRAHSSFFSPSLPPSLSPSAHARARMRALTM
jgi:hypothetical protein